MNTAAERRWPPIHFSITRPASPIAPLLVNVFGGSAGGAIKKNKLFYFINYEGRRDASAGSANRTVPTANLRAGIVGYRPTPAIRLSISLPRRRKPSIPAGIGVNAAALKPMQGMPLPNNTTVGRCHQHGRVIASTSRAQRPEHLHLEDRLPRRTIGTRCSFAAICKMIGRTMARNLPNSPGCRRTPSVWRTAKAWRRAGRM